MSFVIYNKETTMLLRKLKRNYWTDAVFATEAAAKAGLTRAAKRAERKGEEFNEHDWAIADKRHFHDNIEQKKTVRVLNSDKEITIAVNTPACCDPSTETYWSM